MTSYCVEISYIDYDDDTTNDIIGPYRSEEKAEADAESLKRTVARYGLVDGANVSIAVRPMYLNRAAVRKEIKDFLDNFDTFD